MFDAVVKGIHVFESENPTLLVDMQKTGAFFFDKRFTNAFLLRQEVCARILRAQKRLPRGYGFMLLEAFRPRSRQLELWDEVLCQLRLKYPDWSEQQRMDLAGDKFVANPHGFGSGHQAAAAVDITLCSEEGVAFFMGTEVQEFSEKTFTDCAEVSAEVKARRAILREALEAEGVINFPDEWWHFSYGDRLWAEVTLRNEAFYAPLV